MIYYISNELSGKLEIKLAKWKRWVREFLPPDPLGGFQSGYARQFSLKDAFRVFLGGVLVGTMKFTVPEARRILNDLHPWMKANGFYAMRVGDHGIAPAEERFYRIYIYPLASTKFGYTIRGVFSSTAVNEDERTETYHATVLGSSSDRIATGEAETARVLGISRLYAHFLSRLAR